MPTTTDYLHQIQQLQSRAENFRTKLATLTSSQKGLAIGSPERRKLKNRSDEVKESLKGVKDHLRKTKELLKEESKKEMRKGREVRAGRLPKVLDAVETQPRRGRPRKDKVIVVEKGKRGRPRKEVVELSAFRKEVEGFRQALALMDAKINRLGTLMQMLSKRRG